MDSPVHKGEFFSFEGVNAFPRPVQKPHPPIIVGGVSSLGARRAVRYEDGWYGFMTDLDATRRCLGWIEEHIASGVRPPNLGELEISVTPPLPITRDVVQRYEDLGVHRLIPYFAATTSEEALRFVDELGALTIG